MAWPCIPQLKLGQSSSTGFWEQITSTYWSISQKDKMKIRTFLVHILTFFMFVFFPLSSFNSIFLCVVNRRGKNSLTLKEIWSLNYFLISGFPAAFVAAWAVARATLADARWVEKKRWRESLRFSQESDFLLGIHTWRHPPVGMSCRKLPWCNGSLWYITGSYPSQRSWNWKTHRPN